MRQWKLVCITESIDRFCIYDLRISMYFCLCSLLPIYVTCNFPSSELHFKVFNCHVISIWLKWVFHVRKLTKLKEKYCTWDLLESEKKLINIHRLLNTWILNKMQWFESLRLTTEHGYNSTKVKKYIIIFPSEPWFSIKKSSYYYRKYHCGYKMILRPSYLHNGISYTGKTASLYWIRALVTIVWLHVLYIFYIMHACILPYLPHPRNSTSSGMDLSPHSSRMAEYNQRNAQLLFLLLSPYLITMTS